MRNKIFNIFPPTDKTVPEPTTRPRPPPPNAHISGPRGTSDPKWGSLRPHSACDQIWSVGVSPRRAPKTGKIKKIGVLGPFRAPGGREISPPDPPKIVNRELRPQEAEPWKVQNVSNIRKCKPGSDGPKIPKTRGTAETALGGGGGGGVHHAPPPAKI